MLDFRHRQLGWARTAVVTLGVLALPEAGVAAARPLESQWLLWAPTINGRMAAREWSEARVFDLRQGVAVWIGNDADTLYLAVLDAGDQSHDWNDKLWVVFDDEGGIAPILYDNWYDNPWCQATPELGEGWLSFNQDQNVVYVEFLREINCAPQIVSGRMSYRSLMGPEGLTYEVAIPLNGPTALQANAGERFGVLVMLVRDGFEFASLSIAVQGNPLDLVELALASAY